jgi:hypothetical protein
MCRAGVATRAFRRAPWLGDAPVEREIGTDGALIGLDGKYTVRRQCSQALTVIMNVIRSNKQAGLIERHPEVSLVA